MALRFNILIENQEPERLVAATRLFGSKLPRHEQTTCSGQVETMVRAEWQVCKCTVTQAMLASIWDFGECMVSPPSRVLFMYHLCILRVSYVLDRMQNHVLFLKLTIILYNSALEIHGQYTKVHASTRQYMPSGASARAPHDWRHVLFVYFCVLCMFLRVLMNKTCLP